MMLLKLDKKGDVTYVDFNSHDKKADKLLFKTPPTLDYLEGMGILQRVLRNDKKDKKR